MRFLSLLVVFFHLVTAYDKEDAAFWAQDCAFGCKVCPNNSTCGSAYFVTHALSRGNWGYGYEVDCKTLWFNFKNGKYDGWTFAGIKETDIYRGDVVIMNNGRHGDASHCCIGTGNGLVSCHGPGNQNVPPYVTGFFDGYINGVYTYVETTNIKSSICNECTGNVCSILPEPDTSFPCYQGTPKNTNACHKTDPLIKTDTYVCDTCASQGYSNYLQNDPIYKNMELWSKNIRNEHELYSGIYGDTIISCSPYDADACNCVYYARDRQKSLPSGLTTCDDKKSKVNSHSPAPGCVLFRTGDPTYCHAAYVTKVANGNVYYDQANWTPCKCSSDYLSTSSSAILGYWCP